MLPHTKSGTLEPCLEKYRGLDHRGPGRAVGQPSNHATGRMGRTISVDQIQPATQLDTKSSRTIHSPASDSGKHVTQKGISQHWLCSVHTANPSWRRCPCRMLVVGKL